MKDDLLQQKLKYLDQAVEALRSLSGSLNLNDQSEKFEHEGLQLILDYDLPNLRKALMQGKEPV